MKLVAEHRDLERRFELTRFGHKRDNNGHRISTDWAELTTFFEHAVGEKDGLAFSVGTFDGTRGSANLRSRSAVVIDIDGEKVGNPPPSFDEIKARLAEAGVAAVLHTTHSHTPDMPRFRLLMPLSGTLSLPSDVDRAEALFVDKQFPQISAELLGLIEWTDTTKLGAESLMFMPRCPPERLKLAQTEVIEGRPLCLDTLIEIAGQRWQQEKRRRDEAAAKAFEAAAMRSAARQDGRSLIARLRDALPTLTEVLHSQGYRYFDRDKRWLHPLSTSGMPGVLTDVGADGVERSFSHHASDPLCGSHPVFGAKAHDVVDHVIAAEFGTSDTAWQIGIRELARRYLPAVEAGEALARDSERVKGIPVIRYVQGELSCVLEEAEGALMQSRIFFRRGAALVRPEVERRRSFHGTAIEIPVFRCADATMVVEALARCARFQKQTRMKSGDGWKAIDPPEGIAKAILVRQDVWPFPQVTAILNSPTIRPDGTVLDTPGYDAATGLYLVSMPAMPAIPAPPSKEDAFAELSVLLELLAEFPFVSEEGKSVALSGILSVVCRPAFPVVPLHCITAPTPGSGKSYLVDVIAAIGTGTHAPVTSWSDQMAENEKRLDGAFLDGSTLIAIDNVSTSLGGDKLCMAVERPRVRVRRLGVSDAFEIENRAVIFATGNNLTLSGDITRRSLIANLDPGQERPELRQFAGKPTDAVFADRGRYVGAALTIVSAYIAAGRPEKRDPLASFEGWSDTVRSALVWLGCADPVATMLRAIADDPVHAARVELILALVEALGRAEFTIAELVAGFSRGGPVETSEIAVRLSQDIRLRAAVREVALVKGDISEHALQAWFRDNQDRIVAGHRLMKRQGRPTKWRVVPV
jgi:putative DNA primase/helicase